MTPSNDTKERMDRVLEAVGRSVEVMNDLTPSQIALIDELGVEPAELWLGILALLLSTGGNKAGRGDHHHAAKGRHERTTRGDDERE